MRAFSAVVLKWGALESREEHLERLAGGHPSSHSLWGTREVSVSR